MKWKEWVETVENKMKEEGIEDDPEIFYIDTHMPETAENVEVGYHDGEGLMVTSF